MDHPALEIKVFEYKTYLDARPIANYLEQLLQSVTGSDVRVDPLILLDGTCVSGVFFKSIF